jgi:hypothetical protein
MMIEPGTTLHNHFNGETFVFTEGETGGEKCSFDVILGPGGSGGGNALEHIHPLASETFTVHDGILTVTISGREHTVAAGESVTIPKGAPHHFANGHDGETRATVTFEPAQSFIKFFANFAATTEQYPQWYSKHGDPKPLFVAVTLNAYQDHFYLAKPSVNLQKWLFALMAPIARLLGYRLLLKPGRSLP